VSIREHTLILSLKQQYSCALPGAVGYAEAMQSIAKNLGLCPNPQGELFPLTPQQKLPQPPHL